MEGTRENKISRNGGITGMHNNLFVELGFNVTEIFEISVFFVGQAIASGTERLILVWRCERERVSLNVCEYPAAAGAANAHWHRHCSHRAYTMMHILLLSLLILSLPAIFLRCGLVLFAIRLALELLVCGMVQFG